MNEPEDPHATPPDLPYLDVRDDCPALEMQPDEFESIDHEDEGENALLIHRHVPE